MPADSVAVTFAGQHTAVPDIDQCITVFIFPAGLQCEHAFAIPHHQHVRQWVPMLFCNGSGTQPVYKDSRCGGFIGPKI